MIRVIYRSRNGNLLTALVSKSSVRISALLFLLLVAAACSSSSDTVSNTAVSRESDIREKKLLKVRDAVIPFFETMQKRPGDWLESQREKGETFEEYIASQPTLPTDDRKTIYILPIGKFTRSQKDVIAASAEYMRAYYSLPVKLMPEKPLGVVPKDKQRESGYPKRTQIRASHFLDTVLPPLLPTDAAALIAFTNHDLYPSDTWAFVFGMATFNKRVGVWSLYRLGEKVDNSTFLDRTLKIAMHETGHMFSMRHCTKYECLMSGTNHLAETDRRPLDNCPECVAKLAWAMDYDPEQRYKKLADFWRKQGNKAEEKKMNDKAAAVKNIK